MQLENIILVEEPILRKINMICTQSKMDGTYKIKNENVTVHNQKVWVTRRLLGGGDIQISL